MDIRKLEDRLSVGPQISVTDVATLAQHGFRTIICNRPDGEGDDQPGQAEFAKAAEAEGVAFRYIPITPGKLSDADIEAFATALKDLPSPAFAFCRTGMRSTTLWSLSEAPVRDVSEILSTANAAGYDLSGVAERIAARGKQSN